MIIDGISVTAEMGVTEEEIQQILIEEKANYATQGKTLASVNISIDGEELIIKAKEKSPIKRIRRITGYLSEQNNFNAGKQAELADRVIHNKNLGGM